MHVRNEVTGYIIDFSLRDPLSFVAAKRVFMSQIVFVNNVKDILNFHGIYEITRDAIKVI